MITVTILKNSNSDSVGFVCEGHAGYEESGKDIVCSAVSALAITTVNSVESLCSDDFLTEASEDGGYLKLLFKEQPGHDAGLILKVFETGITGIYESYGDYICLTFKEV
jgi:hypothetical protein